MSNQQKKAWKRSLSKVFVTASIMTVAFSGVITQPGVAQAIEPIVIQAEDEGAAAVDFHFDKKEIVWSDGERFNGDGLFDGGDGSYENPYLISSRDQLELLHQDASGSTHYKLTRDIDLSGTPWTPIPEFAGSIDGGGHAIINLAITGSDDNTGFIATTIPGRDVKIKDLDFRNAEIRGNGSRAAVAIGYAQRTMDTPVVEFENVKLSGSVANEVGVAAGLVGELDYQSTLNVIGVNSTLLITGNEAYGFASGYTKGNLLKDININGTIHSSNLSSGMIADGENITFQNIEFDGELHSEGVVFGIANSLYSPNLENVTVKGSVNSRQGANGVARGLFYQGKDVSVIDGLRVIADIKSDGDISGISEILSVDERTVKIQDVEFRGSIESVQGSASLFNSGIFSEIGSEKGDISIQGLKISGNIIGYDQANGLAPYVDGTNAQDIQLDLKVSSSNGSASGFAAGLFKNSKLTNINGSVDVSSQHKGANGLFNGVHDGSHIKNVNLTANVRNLEGDSYGSISGLAGGVYNGSIIEQVRGIYDVEGTYLAGGIAYHAGEGAVIRDIDIKARVVSSENGAGGIAGRNYTSVISNVKGTYDVSGTQSVGGVSGENGGTIKDIDITSKVNGQDSVGGISGTNVPNGGDGKIQNAKVKSIVSGLIKVGGAVGFSVAMEDGVLVDQGSKVSGHENVGGVIGEADNSSLIRKSLGSLADVSGDENVGGVAGSLFVPIEESFALGKVTGKTNVGGFAGIASSDYSTSGINNAYADAVVTGTENVGGLIGSLNGGKVNHVYAAGHMNVQESGAGLIGYATGDFSIEHAFSLNDWSNKKLPLYFGTMETSGENEDGESVEYNQSIRNLSTWNEAEQEQDISLSSEKVFFLRALTAQPYKEKTFEFIEEEGPWKIINNRTLPYFTHPVFRNWGTNNPIDPVDPDTGGIYPNDPDDGGSVVDPGDGEDPGNGGDGNNGGEDGTVNPGEGNGGGGGGAACPDVRSIEVYVHVAELSKRDPHITNAIKKIEQLPDCKEKAAFEERIHAIYEWLKQYEYDLFMQSLEKNLDWAGKYEREPYLSAVGDKIGGVQDEAKKDEIQSELDAIYDKMTATQKAAALKNATTLVTFAERYEREPYLSRAEEALKNTPPSAEKEALEARFNAVMDKLGQAAEERKLAAATEAVTKAEAAGSIFAIEDAQALVDDLRDGEDKTALTDRLAAIEITDEMAAVYELKMTIAGIEDPEAKAAFEKAYDAILAAEEKGSRYTAPAEQAVAALEAYEEDDVLGELTATLTGYLDRVKHGQAVAAAVTAAENAVVSAERYARDLYVTRADEAMAALKELEPDYDTAELDARLQVIRDRIADAAEAANLANAEKQLVMAERYKRDPYLTRAQNAIDVLRDGDEKTALQERLAAVTN